MACRERIFGVVVPVPHGLSRIANRIRRRCDPNFRLIGPHVTVLPPRPLSLTRREVLEAVKRVAERTPPFPLRLGGVKTFLPVKAVVFVGFRRGTADLEQLHRRLSRAPLRAREPFPYVPHLTLAQELDGDRLREAFALSRKTFASSAALKAWLAESLVVVERRSACRWIALDPLSLRRVSPPGTNRARRTRRR
jgi:2'-5' RNA ligase